MKKAIILLAMMMGLHSSMGFAAIEQAKLADFPVYINGELINNQRAAYPLLVYKNITYFPMTWDFSSGLGLSTTYTNEQGLVIKNGGSPSALKQTLTAQNDLSKAYEIKMPDFLISMNGNPITNEEEVYPIFTFRGITYFPLTWRFVVDEFGWKSEYTNENGLSISSLNAASAEVIKTDSEENETDSANVEDGTAVEELKKTTEISEAVEIDEETTLEESEETPSVEKLKSSLDTVRTSVGNEVYLPNQTEVIMSDGEVKSFRILWNQDQLNGSRYENYYNGIESGKYTIEGKLYLHEYFDVEIDVIVEEKIEFENPGLKKIVERRLYNKNIEDITIQDLEIYETLEFVPSDYGITDLDGIGVFPNLKELNLLGDCRNIDFSGLQELDGLETLRIDRASPDKIKDVFDVESIVHLRIEAQRTLEDFDGVEKLTNLQTLVIRDYIEDPSALVEISNDVEITWMNKSFDETLSINNEVIEVEARLDLTEANHNYAEELAKEIVDDIIEDGMSDEEKVRAIHDYIVTHVKYDHENFNKGTLPRETHTLYGALVNKSAVCDGFAYAFDTMARYSGLETEIVRGNAFSTIYTNIYNHAWNLVEVDGVYKHVDTSSDSLRDFSDPIRYDYSLKSDSEMGITHIWDTSRYPESK